MLGFRQMHITFRRAFGLALLEREIAEIASREKEHLGRELHDGLCQSLAGIAALSSALSRDLATHADPAASATAAEIAQLLNETISQARNLAHGLDSSHRKYNGIAEALETVARDIRHLFHVSCLLECDPFCPQLSHETRAHLRLIAQEAARNAIDHGHADHIEIGLKCDAGIATLTIADDGAGIPDEVGCGRGMGLRTMGYRARAIGGSLAIARRSPRGTAVFCAFPVSGRRSQNGNSDLARGRH